MKNKYASWGNYPASREQRTQKPAWRSDDVPRVPDPLLAYGCGRSYGDVCLNNDGVLIDTRLLNRFIHFDTVNGILRAEAGIRLDEILDLIVSEGWFLPVTPGTKFVTLGGAIANDVHGKNHHRAGTFGGHVTRFELLRSTGERLLCSPQTHQEYYQATIGGLGLTGLITWAEFRLKRIKSSWIDLERVRFNTLDEFFYLSDASDATHEYTVAWIDASATGRHLGRGWFMRGNHNEQEHLGLQKAKTHALTVPCLAPSWLMNTYSIKTFNTLYYHASVKDVHQSIVSYEPFFYPLDAVLNWNRLYGHAGFLQYQCVIPRTDGARIVRDILTHAQRQGSTSFLTVLKIFGEQTSPGMLSFPKPGVTLAIDFRFKGAQTLRLLDALDALVLGVGGRIYPAKDARMSVAMFKTTFPNWERIARLKDPKFCSDFWKRVTT